MGTVDNNTLQNRLAAFFVSELDSRVIDGITYSLLISDDRHKEKIDSYIKLCQDMRSEFDDNAKIKMFRASNGYIFDMDVTEAKKMVYAVSKSFDSIQNDKTSIKVKQMIVESADKRRKADITLLARYIKSCVDKDEFIVDVALFSRNSSNKITLTGIGPKGEMLKVVYNAYALRPTDIEILNSRILMPNGMRVSKVEPCEILPSRNGAKFRLYVETISPIEYT